LLGWYLLLAYPPRKRIRISSAGLATIPAPIETASFQRCKIGLARVSVLSRSPMPLDDAHLGDIFLPLENYFLRFSLLAVFFTRSRDTTA
jgi:hypothetical protein